LTTYLFAAFLLFGIINFVFSILILRQLTRLGVEVSFYEIRWQIHKHLKTYKRLTLEQDGRIAWPYYGYTGSLACLAIFGLLTCLSVGD
jgi:hypothetical protein